MYSCANHAADDRSAKQITPESVKKLGEIKVEWHWVRITKGGPSTGKAEENFKADESIPEKCLKGRAISQVAKYDTRYLANPHIS